jgi:hypothetical protein
MAGRVVFSAALRDLPVHRRQARVQRFENMGRENTGAQHCQKRYQHFDRAFS